MKQIKKTIICFVSALLIFTNVGGFLTANSSNDVHAQEVNSANTEKVEQIESEIRFLFEEASQYNNGQLTIDYELLEAIYGRE